MISKILKTIDINFSEKLYILKIDKLTDNKVSLSINPELITEEKFNEQKIHKSEINSYIENWIYNNCEVTNHKFVDIKTLSELIQEKLNLIQQKSNRRIGNNVIINKNILNLLDNTEVVINRLKSDNILCNDLISEHFCKLSQNKIIIYYEDKKPVIDCGIFLLKKDDYYMVYFNNNASNYFQVINVI